MATFKEAFAKALEEKGTGKVFTWNGKQYTTNLAGGKTQKPKANPQVVDMAGKGNDKSLAPKAKVSPKARPSLAPKTSIKPQTRTSAAVNTSNKPKVDSTGPTQPKAIKNAGVLKITRGTGPADAGAPKRGVTSVLSKAKELMTKGSVSGSAYDARQAAKKQRTKDIEKALFDQRVQRAEDEEKKAMKGKGGR